jgi:hypothetical protein
MGTYTNQARAGGLIIFDDFQKRLDAKITKEKTAFLVYSDIVLQS